MPTLTRANYEAEMIVRVGVLLVAAGKDGTTVNGTNVALNGPAREALISLGITPAAFTTADADFSTLEASHYRQLFDMAELRALRNIHNALTAVDTQVLNDFERSSQLRESVGRRIAELAELCRVSYGFGLTAISAGTIDLDFQSDTDDIVF